MKREYKKYKASVFERAAARFPNTLTGACYQIAVAESGGSDFMPIRKHERLFACMHKPAPAACGHWLGEIIEENQVLRGTLLAEAALCLREQGFAEEEEV